MVRVLDVVDVSINEEENLFDKILYRWEDGVVLNGFIE